MTRVVLVTGVSRYLGGRFARALSDEPEHRPGHRRRRRPPAARHRVRRVRPRGHPQPGHRQGHRARRRRHRRAHERHRDADARRRAGLHEGDQRHRHDAAARGLPEGAASLRAAGREVVRRRSTASSPRDPAMFTEDTGAKALPRSGFGKDSVEVEGYVRGFSRRRPDVEVAMLRFANIIGPGHPDGAHRLLHACRSSRPCSGFDARLQFVHEDDAVEAMRLATVGSARRASSTSPATAASLPSRPPGIAGRPTAAGAARRSAAVGQLVRRSGPGRLLAGPDAVPLLRPRARHHPDARGAGPGAAVHHPRGVRRLRPAAGACTGRSPRTGSRPPRPSSGRPREVSCRPRGRRRERRPPVPAAARRRPRRAGGGRGARRRPR